MLRTIVFTFILGLSQIALSQTGFYKNIFGDYDANINTTVQISSIDSLSGERHFVTGAQRPYADYFSCSVFDSDWNEVWTTAYEASSGATNYFQYGVELEDNRIISIGIHNSLIFIAGHDDTGNLLFSNYYGTVPGTDYFAGSICESTEDDTSFVALFAQCAVDHGLFKFDKDGNVIWSFDYGAIGQYYANVYALDQAINGGYISGGSYIGPVEDTTQHYGYLAVSKPDGTFNKGMKYYHTSNTNNSTLITRLYTAHKEHGYYVNFVYGDDYTGPWYYEESTIVAKLDSNLNIETQWKFSVADTNQTVRVEEINQAPDNTLLITGRVEDAENYPSSQFFIMKFDPNVTGGQVIWCKTFQPIILNEPWVSTSPRRGIYTSGDYDQIYFSYAAHTDGSCISSIDQNGEGHCLSEDRIIDVEEVNDMVSFTYTYSPTHHPVQAFNVPLTPYVPEHDDSTFCYESSLSIDSEPTEETLIEVYSEQRLQSTFINTSDKEIELQLYSINGMLLYTRKLAGHQSFVYPFHSSGIYIYKAEIDGIIQSGKIVH